MIMDFSNIPAAAPPPGMVSNFSDPKTLSTSLIVLNAIFLSIMLIVVGARLYSRAFLSRAIGWDDCKCRWMLLSSTRLTILRHLSSRRGGLPSRTSDPGSDSFH